MQNQSLARIEADAEAPFLPANLVALDDEARAGRLHDLQRLDVVAESGAIACRVVAVLHRDVGLAIIVDAQNLGPVEIDHGAKPLDRMGIAVVVLLAPVPAEGVREPPALLVRQAVIAGRPGVDLDVVDVGDAAFGQRRPKARIGPGHFADQSDVVDQDARPHAGHMPPVDDLIRDEIDPRLEDLAIGAVERADEGLARKGRPGLEPRTTLLSGSCS